MTTDALQSSVAAPSLAAPRCVIIAGGGTGGHLIPGLAVARELRRSGVEHVVFVGTERGIEARLVPSAGFELRLIHIQGLNRVSLRRKFQALAALPQAVRDCLAILRESRAEAVFGLGGYASGPMLLAALLRRLPIVAFEPNANSGMANRLLARWITCAAIAFEETRNDFPCTRLTGVPVRPEFFNLPATAPHQPLRILAFGGSQGARALNRVLPATATLWRQQGLGVSLIHQTGGHDYNDVRAAYDQAGLREVQVQAFIEDMPEAMGWADLVICRSGGSTLAELAAAGRPSVLIPFPGAADDHQMRNARAFAALGSAEIMPQKDLSAEKLAALVRDLTVAPGRLCDMAGAARRFARPQAAAAMAALLCRAARHESLHQE